MDTWIGVAAAAGGVVTGAGAAWAFMEWRLVRPLQRHLKAAHESQNDVVGLWKRERKQLNGEIERLAGQVQSERAAADTYAMIADLATAGAEYQQRKRQEALRSVGLVLSYYGREVERADAAEAALARELVVSAGLERLVGQERAA